MRTSLFLLFLVLILSYSCKENSTEITKEQALKTAIELAVKEGLYDDINKIVVGENVVVSKRIMDNIQLLEEFNELKTWEFFMKGHFNLLKNKKFWAIHFVPEKNHIGNNLWVFVDSYSGQIIDYAGEM